MPRIRRQRTGRRSRGFTLIELLIVVSVICLLMATLLPALQQARDAVRRTQCRNNLMQIGLGLSTYNQAHGVLPPGCVNTTGPIVANESGYRIGWVAQILPFMDEEAAWRQIDFVDPTRSFMSPEERTQLDDAIANWQRAQNAESLVKWQSEVIDSNTPEGQMRSAMMTSGSRTTNGRPPQEDPSKRLVSLPWLKCPAMPQTSRGTSSYAGCHNSTEQPIDMAGDGLLCLNSSESLDSIPDGSSTTLLAGDHLNSPRGQGWMFGDRMTLRNGDTLQGWTAAILRESDTGLVGDYSTLNDNERQQKLKELNSRVGTFGSAHGLHVHFVLADGSVRAINRQISSSVFRRLISRNDGQVVSGHEF